MAEPLIIFNKNTVHLKRTEEWLEVNKNNEDFQEKKTVIGTASTFLRGQKKAYGSSEVQRQRKATWLNLARVPLVPCRLPVASDFPIVQFNARPPFSCYTWRGNLKVKWGDHPTVAKRHKLHQPSFDARFDLALSLAQHNRSWWFRKRKTATFTKFIVYIYFMQLPQGNLNDEYRTQVYVGITTQGFTTRLQQHCDSHKTLCDIALHLVDPLYCRFFVLDMAESNESLRSLEGRYIRMFNAKSAFGLNMVDGSSK